MAPERPGPPGAPLGGEHAAPWGDDVATRGRLVTYLGTAPGVGKTYRMLADGRARAGDDVVIGWVERHGRAATRDQALGLEIVPPRKVVYRGFEFEDVDVAAVIERRPDLVLVDELAHTDPDGRKRYEVVEQILDAGIDVLTTVNIANLLSVRDVAARITGAGALEAVPDRVVRGGRRARRSAARGAAAPDRVRAGVLGRSGGRRARQLLPAVEPRPPRPARPRVGRRHRRRHLRVPRPRGGRPAEGHRRGVELDAGAGGDRTRARCSRATTTRNWTWCTSISRTGSDTAGTASTSTGRWRRGSVLTIGRCAARTPPPP